MDIDSETRNINQHLEKGNFHAAINLALSAMNACRKENNQAGIDYFIDMIKGIAQSLEDNFGS